MMRAYMIAAALVFLTIAPPAKAADEPVFSAAELVELCISKYDTDYGYCAGYVSAVAGLLLRQSVGGYSACNYERVKSQQFVDIFKTYADIFPEQMKLEASVAIAAALARAFPCKK
jgi:hypothetical protein